MGHYGLWLRLEICDRVVGRGATRARASHSGCLLPHARDREMVAGGKRPGEGGGLGDRASLGARSVASRAMEPSASTAPPRNDDASTSEAEQLLLAMEQYHPVIPDAVTQYFLGLSGYQSTDPRVTRIASIAAHKFVADLTNDAMRHCKARQQGKGRMVLTTEDLAQSARDYGIHIRKSSYFADLPSTAGPGGLDAGGPPGPQ